MNEDDVGNIAGNDVMLLAVFKRSHTGLCNMREERVRGGRGGGGEVGLSCISIMARGERIKAYG